MTIKLKRYWIEFEIQMASDFPPGVGHGCGLNAFNFEDALNILNEKLFFSIQMPPIKKISENVDLSTLDQNHVIPNMKAPVGRGIWFPLGVD